MCVCVCVCVCERLGVAVCLFLPYKLKTFLAAQHIIKAPRDSETSILIYGSEWGDARHMADYELFGLKCTRGTLDVHTP